MAERVYCIVKKDGDYYIPVKAKLNPYNRRRAYLACLPNFFGGKMEDGENDEQNDENNRALKQWKTDVGTKDAFRVLFGLH